MTEGAGLTHGLRETRALHSERLVEVHGHATVGKAQLWRDEGFELHEKKRDVMESLPDKLWTEILSYLRRGYGVRVVVTEPTHF